MAAFTSIVAAVGVAAAAAQAERARRDAKKAADEQKARLAKLDAEQKAIGPPAKRDTSKASVFARKTGKAGTIVTGDFAPATTKKKTLLG